MSESPSPSASRPPAAARRHALATLRHRNFRLLALAQFLSFSGQQLQFVAISWHVYLLTDSPLQVGLIGLFRAVPFIVLSFAGGAAADMVDRKKIMLVTQACLLFLAGLLTAASAMDMVSPWLIYAVALLSGVALAFDTPAYQAMVPNAVPRGELASALTLATLLRQTASIAGPGVGGVMIGQLGLGPAYGLTALVFLAVIGAVLLIGRVPMARAASRGGWDRVLGGLRYARAEPLVLAVMALDFVVAVVGSIGAARTLLPVFARDILLVGPEGLGLLHAAPAAGAVVGATVLGAMGGARRPVGIMLIASAAQGIFYLGFGLSPVFGLTLAVLFAMGAANVVAEVLRATIVQLRTPDELRGRVTALSVLFSHGGPHLGMVQSGILASALGPVAAAAIGGVAVVLVAAGFGRLPAIRSNLAKVEGRPGAEVKV